MGKQKTKCLFFSRTSYINPDICCKINYGAVSSSYFLWKLSLVLFFSFVLTLSPSLSIVLSFSDALTIMCPRSNYPFYIVSYCIKWVTTSWTYSTVSIRSTISGLVGIPSTPTSARRPDASPPRTGRQSSFTWIPLAVGATNIPVVTLRSEVHCLCDYPVEISSDINQCFSANKSNSWII